MSNKATASKLSEAALEKQKRAEADKPYQPYVHDIGGTGALTGKTMPTNIARSGEDGMENITDFFRSPEQGGGAASSSRTTSFAALGGPTTPSGPSKTNGSDGRGSSIDVENAVNEANDEDNQEGDDTFVKPQYFPPVKRTPPPQLAASSSRRTPQPDAASLYNALPSPSRSHNQSPYGSASRIPIAVNRRSGSYAPPSPSNPHHRSATASSQSPRSAKKTSALAPSNGQTRARLSELTNGLSSPNVQDQSLSMDDEDEDVGVGRDAASPMSRGRPSKVFRPSAAGTEVTRNSPTYSDEGREEYDPQPEHNEEEDVTRTTSDPNEEDDEEEEEDQEIRAGPSKKKAGKGKVSVAATEDEEEEEEEDAAEEGMGAMDDYDTQGDDAPQDEEQEQEEEPMEEQDDEEEEEEEPVVIQSKKGKGKEKAVPPKAPKKKPASPTRKRLADMSDESDDGSGSRRSKRKRFEPLEYWRGEKLVYGRRESGRGVVPIVKEVLRLPKEEVRRLGDAAGPRGRSMSVKPKLPKKPKREHNEDDSGSEGGRDDGVPPEFGWDADTVEHGVVMDYASKTEIERRIAFPSHLLEYRTMPGDPNSFKFQKVFGDASFVAAGMLEIPVGGEKPSKPTKDNTYLFYVIEGAVTVKVHRTSFTMAPGGQFMVPRGNQYSLHTISHRPAKLFFAQARKMAADEEDVAPAPVVASTSKAKSVAARSGAGPAAKAINGKKKGGR